MYKYQSGSYISSDQVIFPCFNVLPNSNEVVAVPGCARWFKGHLIKEHHFSEKQQEFNVLECLSTESYGRQTLTGEDLLRKVELDEQTVFP